MAYIGKLAYRDGHAPDEGSLRVAGPCGELRHAQCTTLQAPDWPALGSATEAIDIDPSLLPAAGSAGTAMYADPFFAPELPWQFYVTADFADVENGTLRPGIVSHHYPHVTVAGHYRAAGAYVSRKGSGVRVERRCGYGGLPLVV